MEVSSEVTLPFMEVRLFKRIMGRKRTVSLIIMVSKILVCP